MDNNRQLLYRKQYWYIIVTVIVISLLFFVISFLDISSSWSNTFLNLSMIILGASIASIIQEYILGEYYKQQYKKNIVESLAPDFNDLKKTVNGAIDKIVKDVTDRTTDSIGDIQKRVAEASDFMLNGINVLKGADIAGIIDIFPNRYSDCHGEETVKDMIIKDFYAEKNMIYLMGISLGDYFLDGRGALHRHRAWQPDQEIDRPQHLPDLGLLALHRTGEVDRRYGSDHHPR